MSTSAPTSCWWLLCVTFLEPRACARWLLTTVMGAQLLSTQTPEGFHKTRDSLLARRAGIATQV